MDSCLICHRLGIEPRDETTFNELFTYTAAHPTASRWIEFLNKKRFRTDSNLPAISVCELHFPAEDIIRPRALSDSSLPIFCTEDAVLEHDQIIDLECYRSRLDLRGWNVETDGLLVLRQMTERISVSADLDVQADFDTDSYTTGGKVLRWSKLRGLLKKVVLRSLESQMTESQVAHGWKVDGNRAALLIYRIELEPIPRITESVLIDTRLRAKVFMENGSHVVEHVEDLKSVEEILERFEKIRSETTRTEPLSPVEIKIEANMDVKDEEEEEEEREAKLEVPKKGNKGSSSLTRFGRPRCDKRGIRALRTCDHCGYTCFYVRDMTNHMKSNHMQAEILCCGKLWNNFRYRVHNRTVHAKDKCCELCGQRFGYNNYLRVHMSEVHGKRGEFVCKHCEKDFPINSQLKNHLVEVHGENVSMILCDICGDGFLALHALVTHKKFYHKVGSVSKVRQPRPMKTDQVKVPRRQRFSRVSHAKTELPLKLVEQVTQVGPERPFKCELCPLSYSSEVHLKRHVTRIHDVGARKHECSLCPKAFLTNYELNIHVRNTHNRDEQKQCPLCEQKYNTKTGMRKHLLWGHTDSHYRCECGQLTKQVNTLKHHLKKMHNIVPTTKLLVSMKVPDETGMKEMKEIFKTVYKD